MIYSFEGIDGCGKSTQITRVATALARLDIPYVICSPASTAAGLAFKKVLIHNTMSANAQYLGFYAIWTILQETIKQHTDKVVLLDRYIDSTFVHQIFGSDAPKDLAEALQKSAPILMPQATFYFNISLEEQGRRISSRVKDIFEGQPKEYYQKIIDGYEYLASTQAERFLRVDATLPIEEITDIIVEEILERELEQGSK